MIYTWHDRINDRLINVERKMADSDVPPTEEECITKNNYSKEEYEKAEFTKIIHGGLCHIGFGAKGRW